MRPLEILIPILLAAHLIWTLIVTRPRAAAALPSLALALIMLHVLTEGARWQMFPLYTLTILIFLAGLPHLLLNHQNTPNLSRAWRLFFILTGMLLLAISTLLPTLLPVPTLLAPSGPYTVGTRTIELADPLRKEIYSGKDESRRFLVQLWYPANPQNANAKPAAWMPEAKIVAPAISEYIRLPVYFLNHLTLAVSNSYQNSPPNRSGGPYPLLVFAHGWNGFRQQSTFLMEELASHGYIVAALEFPYGARLTVFPDGSILPNNPNALPKGKPQAEYEAAAQILVQQWADDIGYTLDKLIEMNHGDPLGPLTGMIAAEKIGVFGHSTGGGATIQFCSKDSRCRAGLTLDAFTRPISPDVLDSGTRQPFFYMFSEIWPFERNTELFERYYRHVQPSNRVVTILGADHYDFSDLPALSPLAPQLGLKGPINGRRVQQIINTYTLGFFNQQFKGIATTLFDGTQPAFPEVRYDH